MASLQLPSNHAQGDFQNENCWQAARGLVWVRNPTFAGVVQKQLFSGYTAERKRTAQAGGMIVRNLNKSAAL
jgi:hypothetical protein